MGTYVYHIRQEYAHNTRAYEALCNVFWACQTLYRLLGHVHAHGSSGSFVLCRPKRPGEVDGVDYFFVSKEQFEEWIRSEELVEWALVYGEYKGIPKAQVCLLHLHKHHFLLPFAFRLVRLKMAWIGLSSSCRMSGCHHWHRQYQGVRLSAGCDCWNLKSGEWKREL